MNINLMIENEWIAKNIYFVHRSKLEELLEQTDINSNYSKPQKEWFASINNKLNFILPVLKFSDNNQIVIFSGKYRIQWLLSLINYEYLPITIKNDESALFTDYFGSFIVKENIPNHLKINTIVPSMDWKSGWREGSEDYISYHLKRAINLLKNK